MTLRFTFRQLEYFVAVGEAGSIAKAAEIVNVSAPSISASIAQLESEFDLQLFVRKHAHGLALTEGGRVLLREAIKLLADAESLHSTVVDVANHVRGPLSIGCLSIVAQIVVPELRRKFEEKFPAVRVRQYERNQEELLDMLLRGEIDVSLTYDLLLSQDTAFEPLLSLPPYVMLPPSHKFAARQTLSLEELAEEPMVLLDMPGSREHFISIFHQRGVRPNVVERTGDISVLRSLVANGFGFGIVTMRPLHTMSPDGKPLVFVPLEGEHRPLVLGIVTPNSTRLTQTVVEFIKHCKEFLGQQGVFEVTRL